MELILGLIAVIILALCFLVDKITNLVKQLKSEHSAKLSKGFEAKLSVIPINKKGEDADTSPPSKTNE